MPNFDQYFKWLPSKKIRITRICFLRTNWPVRSTSQRLILKSFLHPTLDSTRASGLSSKQAASNLSGITLHCHTGQCRYILQERIELTTMSHIY